MMRNDCGGLVVFKTWLAKVRLLADNVTAGMPPEPVKAIKCGLPTASSTTVSWPLKMLIAAGVNPNVKVQVAAGLITGGQLFASENGPPVNVMLLRLRGAFP